MVVVYCPTKFTAYCGEGMTYQGLLNAIKLNRNMTRAPRGAFRVTHLGMTWQYGGRTLTLHDSKLASAVQLDSLGARVGTIDVRSQFESGTVVITPVPDPLVTVATVEPFRSPWNVEPVSAPVAVHGGSLDQVIRDIAGEEARKVAEGTVNEDRVREISREEIAVRGIPQPTVVTVQQAGRDPVALGTVHAALPEVLAWITSGPVLLVGPTGAGKTRLAEDVAKALGVEFHLTGQTISRGDLLGYDTPKGFRDTQFYKAFRGPDTLHLADEIDAWSANATLAFNAALSNGYGSFADSPDPVERGERTYDMAAANTAGYGADRVYCGRNQLDGATLNRYVKVDVGYDPALEAAIAEGQGAWLETVWRVRANCVGKYDRHVVSTRALARGVAMLNQGMAFDVCVNKLLRQDMNATDWDRVKP